MADTAAAQEKIPTEPSNSFRENYKITVHRSNLPEDKLNQILALLEVSLVREKHIIEKDIASSLKKNCDNIFSGTWHTVVGRNFGCSITHDTKYFLFLQVNLLYVLVFKSLE